MTTRSDLAARGASTRRLRAADREWRRLEEFCGPLGLSVTEESVVLYLTHTHLTRSTTGRTARTTLQLLDLAAITRGTTPWSRSPDVGRFLQGLHEQAPLGGSPRADPLYPELVRALVDATMRPTHDQLRNRAAALLAHTTGLPNTVLAELRWRDLSFSRSTVDIHVRDHWYTHLRNLTLHLQQDPDTRICPRQCPPRPTAPRFRRRRSRARIRDRQVPRLSPRARDSATAPPTPSDCEVQSPRGSRGVPADPARTAADPRPRHHPDKLRCRAARQRSPRAETGRRRGPPERTPPAGSGKTNERSGYRLQRTPSTAPERRGATGWAGWIHANARPTSRHSSRSRAQPCGTPPYRPWA